MQQGQEWLAGLLLDTGDLANHRRRLAGPDADQIQALVVPDRILGSLGDDVSPELPLRGHVQVSGGAGAIEPAVQWAAQVPGLDLVSLGVVLRDEADLARNAGRVVAMLDHVAASRRAPDDLVTYVEVPDVRDVGEHAWGAALDELAMADLRLMIRPDSPDGLVRTIDAALDRELRFGVVGDDALGVLEATRSALGGTDAASARRWFTALVTDQIVG